MKKIVLFMLFINFILAKPIGYLGSLFPEWFDIIKKGNLIYGATSSGIRILKFNSSSKLQSYLKYDIGENIYKILLYKNYIIGLAKNDVFLFKFENNKLTLLQDYKIDGDYWALSDIVNKNNIFYVLVRDYNHKSLILSLNNDKLEKVGEIKAEIYYKGLISDNYLILSNFAGGYYVYDISNPSSPTLVNKKSIADGGAYSIFLNKNILYSGTDAGIDAYNFPSFDENFSIGEGALHLSFYHIKVIDNYILGIDGMTSNRFGFINLKDLNVSKMKYYSIGYDSKTRPYSWYEENKTLYACVDEGIKKIELNNFNDVNITKLYEIPIVSGLIIKGNYAYIKTYPYVTIYKRNSDTNFTLVTKIKDKENYGEINSMIIDKNILYIIHNYAITVYDITNPNKPKLISAYEPKDNNGKLITSRGDFSGAEIIGDKLYVSKDGDIDILNIFDISNPKNIKLLGKLTKEWGVNGFKIIGNYAYLVLNNEYISIIDISDPTSPQWTQKYVDTQDTIHSLLVYNNKLFVATWNHILVYDIDKQTGELNLIHSYNVDSVFSMKIKGDYLYTTGGKGLQIFNIKNLDQVYDIAIKNNYRGSLHIIGNIAYLVKSVYDGRGIDVVNLDNLIQKNSISLNKGWNLKASPSFKEINVSNLGCKIYWKWDNVDKN